MPREAAGAAAELEHPPGQRLAMAGQERRLDGPQVTARVEVDEVLSGPYLGVRAHHVRWLLGGARGPVADIRGQVIPGPRRHADQRSGCLPPRGTSERMHTMALRGGIGLVAVD